MSAATLANVSSSASSVTLFAAADRVDVQNRILHNDSSAILYLKYGTTASDTSYTYEVAAGAHWEAPYPVYTGRIDGIWASANGAARTTEVA